MQIPHQAICSLCTALIAFSASAMGGDLKHPDWHPDGKLLVAEGSCAGDVGLYLVDIESGVVKSLYDSTDTDGYPRWFSDGVRVAFHKITARRESQIHVADVSATGDASNVRSVTAGPFDIEPAPSPDGNQMAFSAIGKRGQDIGVAGIDGKRRKVWENLDAENFPSWHPDGMSIIFQATEDEETQIYRRLMTTYQISVLTSGGGPNMAGNLSADGNLLVFHSERSGDREIYIRNLANGSEKRLTQRPGRDGYPKFSPDGQQVAYHSVNESGVAAIKVLDLESSEEIEFSCETFSAP